MSSGRLRRILILHAHAVIGNVEPIYDDSEQELKGYLAFPEK